MGIGAYVYKMKKLIFYKLSNWQKFLMFAIVVSIPLSFTWNQVAEKPPSFTYAETITLKELKEHVTYLASDELEGRFSCTPGAQAAAAYIAKHFQELELRGLPGDRTPYFQEFKMKKMKLKECYLESGHVKKLNWTHFGERFGHFSGEKDVELIFGGYGREEDLKGLDIKGKLVAFFPGEPNSTARNTEKERKKMKAIIDSGAAGFLLIYTDERSRASYKMFRDAYYGDERYYLSKTPEEALNSPRNIVIFASDLAELYGVSTKKFLSVLDEMQCGKNMAGTYKTNVHMKTSYEVYDTLNAKNVIGYIEGTDKKDELIIITAHYDHLGTYRGDVYNGADDNATGVAALLEIAEAFVLAAQKGLRPRRTILFLSPDAEEIGANGSLFYVENPMVPLTHTLVDINIDAIGREDAKRSELKDFVYVYHSANLNADLNQTRKNVEKMLSDKPHIESRKTPPGSDNHMFEREGIPAIAYTTGYSKDYHKSTDEAHKINYKNMHNITRMVFVTIWELANPGKALH